MVLVLNIVIILVLVLITATIINAVEEHCKPAIKGLYFGDTIEKCSVPIVAVNIGNQKFNFIIDSGAYNSVIDSSSLPRIDHTPIEGVEGTAYGIDGNHIATSFVRIDMNQDDIDFVDEFQVLDIKQALQNVKDSFGIEVVGLLGASFLKRYNFVIDFDKYTAYTCQKKQ